MRQAGAVGSPRVFRVTSFGADPSGKLDSTEALEKAIAAAFEGPKEWSLMEGMINLGGAHIYLEGGIYKISQPLRLPAAGAGNLMVSSLTIFKFRNFFHSPKPTTNHPSRGSHGNLRQLHFLYFLFILSRLVEVHY